MSEELRNGMERDAKLAALYRAASQDAPPPTLDDAIRAAARRAVASKPRPLTTSFSRAWRVPLSIAAVLVLSVSLVTLMREESPEITQPRGAESSLPRSATPRQRAESAPIAEEPAAAIPNSVAPDSQKSSGLGLKPSSSTEGIRRDRESVASVTQLRKETAPAAQPDAQPPSSANQALPRAFPDVTVLRDNKVAASAEQPRIAPRRDMGASEPQRPSPAPVAPTETKMQARSEADSTAREPESLRAQPPVPAARSAPQPAAKAPVSSPSATAMEKRSPQTSGILQSYTSQPPEKWLEQIAELRKQGRLEEARASFADFRQRYPDYPLPPAFKEWVKP